MNKEVYEGVMQLIDEKPEYQGILEKILKWHKNDYEQVRGYRKQAAMNTQVTPVNSTRLRHLANKGILKILASTSSKTIYRLKDGEALEKALEEYREYQKAGKEVISGEEVEIPSDMFDVVEGYDDLKEFIFMTLDADRPVHCALIGPPGTAKTLLMSEIERLKESRYVPMGTATKVGLRDTIFEELPRYLIIDDLDKLSNPKDIASLLEWMEKQQITVTKHRLKDTKKGKGWVFATANRTKGIYPELLDRFQVFHIKPYSPQQFVRVVKGYLNKRMDVPPDLAEYIAQQVKEYSVRVREAIRIASVADTEDKVDKAIKIVRKYSSN